jgi:hypothetical protein
MTKAKIIQYIGDYIREHGYPDGINFEGCTITEHECTGGKGDGASMSYIFKVESPQFDDFFVKTDGYYSSWDCSSFDGNAYEVESYERTVKDWKKVK